MTWDGNDRRAAPRSTSQADHDVLIRIDANLSNFMGRFEDHEADNVKSFDNTENTFKVLFKRTGTLQKFMWLLLGGMIVVEMLVGAVKAGWIK